MVNKELLNEIEEYCNLNGLETPKTLNEALRSGFTILKFGTTPSGMKSKERVVEVIKEVIKEVPVEKIVEVIKEVPVEKIVKVSDDTKIDELLIKINTLENNNGQLTNELKRVKIDKEKIDSDLVKCQKEITKLNTGGFDLYGER